MSTKQHSSLALAVISAVDKGEPEPPKDATADSILSFRRELKSADVDGVGRIYFYDPPTVAEREASQKHMRMDEKGLTLSMFGMVDGVIARLKTADGRRPLFSSADRDRLLQMPARTLMALWNALGADQAKGLDGKMVDAAAKK